MSNYSSKALTREEALKLKALGESYDVTPMSIKEAIIAGASSEDESSKEDFLVQALTNDERLDFYRNSSSESGESGGSGEITDFFKTINVELYLSDAIIAYMAQESISSLSIQVGAPSLSSMDIPPEPEPGPNPKSTEKTLAKSAEVINPILLPMTEEFEIYPPDILPAGLPKIIECVCPIGGGVVILLPTVYKSMFTFVEASGSVVMEYSDLGVGYVVANGDCAITIGLPSELDEQPPANPLPTV